MPDAQVLSFYQALHIFPNGVLLEVVLPCPSLLTEVFNFVHLCGIFSLSKWLNLFQGSLVSLVCQRSNLVLPVHFRFRFPSGAILDLGTRSSRSGGVLWRPKTGASDAFHVFECCRVIRSGSLHHVHCIMSSYHHIISLFHLN